VAAQEGNAENVSKKILKIKHLVFISSFLYVVKRLSDADLKNTDQRYTNPNFTLIYSIGP
jgi:hypothetical protein